MIPVGQERTVLMPEASREARQDIFLVLFKEMVDDAKDQIREACPHLAQMVQEQGCGR